MKQAIISNIAKTKLLSDIIHNIAKDNNDQDLKDLEQDLYIELLEKDDELIEYMFDNNQLNYFLTRLVCNNLNSKTSRFYYKYRKNKCKDVSIDDVNLSDLESE